MQKGFEETHTINTTFSTYDPDSEINRLNKINKPVTDYPLSTQMAVVLNLAAKYSRETQGYFDPTFRMAQSGLKLFKIHDEKIDITGKDLILDPTGLVKGYAVDRIAELLSKHAKVSSVLVALGGDVRQFSNLENTPSSLTLLPQGGEGNIKVFDPRSKNKKALRTFNLTNLAISTAGQYERGRHIKNTKKSTVEHMQVSVIAKTCVESDALSTAMLFMPLQKIKELVEMKQGLRVIVVTQDGTVHEF
jgi:FAD:protein FMN transferase